MYGIENMKVDSKGRICLPSFTNAEEGEELLLVKNREYYSIYAKKIFDEIIQNFEELDKDDVIRVICNNILRKMRVDSNCRINLGVEFKENEYLKVVGCRSFVALEQVKKR